MSLRTSLGFLGMPGTVPLTGISPSQVHVYPTSPLGDPLVVIDRGGVLKPLVLFDKDPDMGTRLFVPAARERSGQPVAENPFAVITDATGIYLRVRNSDIGAAVIGPFYAATPDVVSAILSGAMLLETPESGTSDQKIIEDLKATLGQLVATVQAGGDVSALKSQIESALNKPPINGLTLRQDVIDETLKDLINLSYRGNVTLGDVNDVSTQGDFAYSNGIKIKYLTAREKLKLALLCLDEAQEMGFRKGLEFIPQVFPTTAQELQYPPVSFGNNDSLRYALGRLMCGIGIKNFDRDYGPKINSPLSIRAAADIFHRLGVKKEYIFNVQYDERLLKVSIRELIPYFENRFGNKPEYAEAIAYFKEKCTPLATNTTSDS